MDFGRILDRIYEAFCAFFGRILGEAFQVEELALMIRATRGRSMDGWMDGWMDGVDLIICLAIWTLYKQ